MSMRPSPQRKSAAPTRPATPEQISKQEFVFQLWSEFASSVNELYNKEDASFEEIQRFMMTKVKYYNSYLLCVCFFSWMQMKLKHCFCLPCCACMFREN